MTALYRGHELASLEFVRVRLRRPVEIQLPDNTLRNEKTGTREWLAETYRSGLCRGIWVSKSRAAFPLVSPDRSTLIRSRLAWS